MNVFRTVLLAAFLSATSHTALADEPSAWVSSRSCVATTVAKEGPLLSLVAVSSVDATGKVTTVTRLQFYRLTPLSADQTTKFTGVKVDIPGQVGWENLSATGTTNKQYSTLIIILPADGPPPSFALSRGDKLSIEVPTGSSEKKSFSFDLKGSAKAIKTIFSCLN